MIDLNNPVNPVAKSTLDSLSNPSALAASDEYVYAANYAGLVIYKAAPNE